MLYISPAMCSPPLFGFQGFYLNPEYLVGVDGDEVPPVPIPNTEVKLT